MLNLFKSQVQSSNQIKFSKSHHLWHDLSLDENGELWQKLDARQAETIYVGGGQGGNIDYNQLKPADLKYERCAPGTCC